MNYILHINPQVCKSARNEDLPFRPRWGMSEAIVFPLPALMFPASLKMFMFVADLEMKEMEEIYHQIRGSCMTSNW